MVAVVVSIPVLTSTVTIISTTVMMPVEYSPMRWVNVSVCHFRNIPLFQEGLVNYLEVGERCKTDDGYCGSTPMYEKCPQSD